MSDHRARVTWNLGSGDFRGGRYSREHTWAFDGGVTVPASASPTVVKPPFSNPACVDPEEAFVASLSSCHLLTFLYLAGRAGFTIESYEDDAVGYMEKNERRVPWVARVVLTPKIAYAGDRRPTDAEEAELHHRAHLECFISNSVKTEVTVARPGEPKTE